jgi:hypothetical protein
VEILPFSDCALAAADVAIRKIAILKTLFILR